MQQERQGQVEGDRPLAPSLCSMETQESYPLLAS